MRRLAAIILALWLAAPGWAQWPYHSVAELFNGTSGGSATLVAYSKDGAKARLLSCWHVFEDGVQRPYVTFGQRPERYYCRVLGIDRRNDLSALEIDAPEGIDTPRCVRAATKSDGEVVAVGYPWYAKTKVPHFSKGKLLACGDECRFSAPVHSGFSGGALLAPDGSLIGVVCGYAKSDGRKYSYAPSGDAFLNFAAKFVEVQR